MKKGISRRKFLAPVVTGAAAAAMVTPGRLVAGFGPTGPVRRLSAPSNILLSVRI
jgi:hypothetical protein